jgi:hypothetical protein
MSREVGEEVTKTSFADEVLELLGQRPMQVGRRAGGEGRASDRFRSVSELAARAVPATDAGR